MRKQRLTMGICFVLLLGLLVNYMPVGAYYYDAYSNLEQATEIMNKYQNLPAPTIKKVKDYWSEQYETYITYNFSNYNDVKLSLYRSVDGGEFVKIEDEFDYDYELTGLVKGHTYRYAVKASLNYYTSEDQWDEATLESPFSATLSYTEPVLAGSLTSVKCQQEKNIKLTWNKQSGVSGYEIYRAVTTNASTNWDTVKMSKYKDVAATTSSYVDNAVSFGKCYGYRIVPYVQIGTNRVYGPYSKAMSAQVTFAAVTKISAKILDVTKIKLSWAKHANSKVKGYYIYRSTSKNGPYKQIKNIKSRNTTSYKVTKLTNGVTYYYKVCAYGKVSGKKLVGTLSGAKSRVMNVLGYDMEPWEHRSTRIYGSKNQRKYSSDKNARKYMTTITIKVWDFRSGTKGKKVTRVKYLTVNKYLAKTYKQIFKEIYKGKEKFPIKDIGCYSFRVGEHSRGTAVDINPNENYMIDGKKIMCGSFWKPKKNPYSIALHGEVAKIMNKYGFYQGLWGNRRDYMHFSYFGG